MKGLHPALCGWLSAATAVLDVQIRLAGALIGTCARGPESGPEIREVLAASVYVLERLRQEFEGRITELFGAVEPSGPAPEAWLKDVDSSDLAGGLAALAGAANTTREAWQQAGPVVDAHTRLLLRLQLAQLDAVVVPGLVAACRTVDAAPRPQESLTSCLSAALPTPTGHPEDFLGLVSFREG